jgi:hypothetical protein
MQQLEKMANSGECAGGGASNASHCFDQAIRRVDAAPDRVHRDTPVFQGRPAPTVNTNVGLPTPAVIDKTKETYISVPGGIVLEGAAADLGEIEDVMYDKRFNAFIVNDRAAFFLKVSPRTIAELCRAFAEDDKQLLGVSLGDNEIVYGKVAADSDIAWDLKLADKFLGDIVFAENSWTRGYKFADGYTPQKHVGPSYSLAVFFTFKDFRFRVEEEEIFNSESGLDIMLIPLTGAAAADGGHEADEAAVQKGLISEQYQANANHIAANTAYYRQEPLIQRLFAYGEAAAFIRQLKASGFDLIALAENLSGANP